MTFDSRPQGFRGQSVVVGRERFHQIGGRRHEPGIPERNTSAIFRHLGPDRNRYPMFPVIPEVIGMQPQRPQYALDDIEDPANKPLRPGRHHGRDQYGFPRIRLQRRDGRFLRGRLQRRDGRFPRIRLQRRDGRFPRTVRKPGLGDLQAGVIPLVEDGFFETCRDQAVGRLPIDEYGQVQFDFPVGEIVVELERRKRPGSRLRFIANDQVGLGEYGDTDVKTRFIHEQVRGRDPRRPRHEPRRHTARQLLDRYAVDAMHVVPDPLRFLSQEQTFRESFVDPFLHARQVPVQRLLGLGSDVDVGAENSGNRARHAGVCRHVGMQAPIAIEHGLQRKRRVNREIRPGTEIRPDERDFAFDPDAAGDSGICTQAGVLRDQRYR